jgi:hypothetical protein
MAWSRPRAVGETTGIAFPVDHRLSVALNLNVILVHVADNLILPSMILLARRLPHLLGSTHSPLPEDCRDGPIAIT